MTAPATSVRPSSGISGSSATRSAAFKLCGNARIAPLMNVRNSSRSIDHSLARALPSTASGLLSCGNAARKRCVIVGVSRARSFAGYQFLAGRASDLDASRACIGTDDLELDPAVLLPGHRVVGWIHGAALAVTGATQAIGIHTALY